MFVDEITIKARAGHGGSGVVRWRREKFISKGGPAGGDGGRGGHIYMTAVRDLGLLSKYTGSKEFSAGDGVAGSKRSRHGGDGEDLYIKVPVGAKVTDQSRDRVYLFEEEGQAERILEGGSGGLGNEHFKSSTNTSPEEFTKGRKGERGIFLIELALSVDAGLIGLPNAGKSTMLNALTNTNVKVASYPFTTVEPHLGDFYGFILADIPGLIEGAADGKGLGHKFLRHVEKTKMLLHCVSLENENPVQAYNLIRSELKKYSQLLLEKEEWVLLTKSDLVDEKTEEKILKEFTKLKIPKIVVCSAQANRNISDLQALLSQHLGQK